MIRSAPLSFLAAVAAAGLLMGIVIWYGFFWHYSTAIVELESAIKSKDERISALQDKINKSQGNKIDEAQGDKSSAQLRLEQLQKRKTQPYTIRKADQEEFVRLLKLAGKFSVNITYPHDDNLAEIFAEELETLVTLATWEVKGGGATVVLVVGGKYPDGVTISVPEKQEVPTGATLLIRLLQKQEIWVTYREVPPREVYPASFDIFIGGKE